MTKERNLNKLTFRCCSAIGWHLLKMAWDCWRSWLRAMTALVCLRQKPSKSSPSMHGARREASSFITTSCHSWSMVSFHWFSWQRWCTILKSQSLTGCLSSYTGSLPLHSLMAPSDRLLVRKTKSNMLAGRIITLTRRTFSSGPWSSSILYLFYKFVFPLV